MPQIRLEPTSRHPLVFFFLYLLIVSGVGIVFGAPAPGSVEEALSPYGVIIWGASLVIGGTCILWGVHLQRALGRRSVNGALFEQVGMALLSAAGILYAVAALFVVKWAGIIPAGLVLGMAAACGYRYFDIRRQIKAYLDRKAQETAAHGDG